MRTEIKQKAREKKMIKFELPTNQAVISWAEKGSDCERGKRLFEYERKGGNIARAYKEKLLYFS